MESILTARTMLDNTFFKNSTRRKSQSRTEKYNRLDMAKQKGKNFHGDNMNEKNVPQIFDRIYRKNFPMIISEVLVTIYEMVSGCQLVVLTSLLKGLLVCGDHVPYEHIRGADNANFGIPVQRRKDSTYTPHMPSNELQNKIVQFAQNVFHHTLSSLCKKHPNTIARMTTTLDTYVPLLSLLPIALLPATLFPIIKTAGHAPESLSCVLNVFRKLLLHKDLERKCFAIRGLLGLSE